MATISGGRVLGTLGGYVAVNPLHLEPFHWPTHATASSSVASATTSPAPCPRPPSPNAGPLTQQSLSTRVPVIGSLRLARVCRLRNRELETFLHRRRVLDVVAHDQ